MVGCLFVKPGGMADAAEAEVAVGVGVGVLFGGGSPRKRFLRTSR